eukprot:gene3313-13340_t
MAGCFGYASMKRSPSDPHPVWSCGKHNPVTDNSDPASLLQAVQEGSVGFSFSGGGFLMAYHVGAYRSLLRLGLLSPGSTHVAGSSAGSLRPRERGASDARRCARSRALARDQRESASRARARAQSRAALLPRSRAPAAPLICSSSGISRLLALRARARALESARGARARRFARRAVARRAMSCSLVTSDRGRARERARGVVEYSGRCERFTYENRPVRFFEDTSKKIAGGSAWLKPQGGAIALPQERFKVLFFVQPGTGELYGRFLSPLIGPIDRWFGPPTYCRVSPELVLTPMQCKNTELKEEKGNHPRTSPHSNADPFSPDPFNASPASGLGASSYVFEPPMDRKAAGAASISGFGNLSSADMPYASWAEPTAISWSPFSLSGKDYVRVVAPGVYVGCAYRKAEAAKSFIDEKGVMQNKGKLMGGEGDFKEEDFVYFLMIRKTQ